MKYDIVPSSEVQQSTLSFWQSSIWSEIIILSWQARESFYFGNKDTTCLHIEIRSIGLGFFGAFSLGISAIQVAPDWDICIDHLQTLLQGRGILFLQIEPIDDIWIPSSSQKNRIYKKFLTPHTRILDLTKTEDEILAQMHEKWRYNIRLASKRGVTVERVNSSKENIDIWIWLLHETLSRDNFAGNSRKYYEIFVSELEKNNQWWLYFASFEGRVIAAGIFVYVLDRAIYYYGASSSKPEDRKQMAPYLLQWHAICEARSRNIPVYDFLWVADPSNPDDTLRWVTDFKEKFWWTLLVLPEKILFPLSWKYSVFLIIFKIKNLTKKK